MGGFAVLVFIKVRWLRLAFASGAPLTVTLGIAMNETPNTSLIRSIATESLTDLLGNISETALDATLESGVLRDIPIIGFITGAFKATRDIRDALFLKKIALFLKELSSVTQEQRAAFVQEVQTQNDQHRFGEALLLLLERAEDMKKPQIVGRLMAASIQGKLDQSKALRLCSIVDRCYVQDFELLRSFRDGVQGEFTPIAEVLHAAGLISNMGINGGDASGNNSGIIYHVNEYGKLLVKHGLVDS